MGMKLDDLQTIGVLAADLQIVRSNYSKIVSLSDILSRENQGEIGKGEIVTVDNPIWFATQNGRPLKEAKSIYSCGSDGTVGCWKQNREFLLMKLVEGRLQTVKQYKFKEVTVMAKQVNLEDEEDIMGEEMEGGQATDELQKINGFDEDLTKYQKAEQPLDDDEAGSTTGSSEMTEDEKEKRKKEREAERQKALMSINEIKRKNAGVVIADRRNVQLHNRNYGRFMFFITATDNTIKVSRKRVPIVDSNQNRQWDPANQNITDEIRNKYKDAKKIPVSYCRCYDSVSFKDSKPGKIVGMCLAIPAGNIIGFDKLSSGETLTAVQGTDLEYMLYTKETGMAAIGASFGKTIRESSRVMGAQAGILMLETKEVKPKKKKDKKEGSELNNYGVEEKEIRTSIKLQPNSCTRKASNMVNSKNYVPLKTFVTIGLDEITDENRQFVDNNVAALFKKADVKLSNFIPEDQAAISRDEKGKYHTKWFTKELSLPEIQQFDSDSKTGNPVSFISIPKRIEGVTNNGSLKYDYEYVALGAEGGPQEKSQFAHLIELAKFSVDEFVKQALALQTTNTGKSSSRTATPTIDIDEALKNIISGKVNSNFAKLEVMTDAMEKANALHATGSIEAEVKATETWAPDAEKAMKEMQAAKAAEAAKRKAEKEAAEAAKKQAEKQAESKAAKKTKKEEAVEA